MRMSLLNSMIDVPCTKRTKYYAVFDHLISRHTIEEKILRLHKTKRDLADSLLSGSNISRAMTIDDLRFLVEQSEG